MMKLVVFLAVLVFEGLSATFGEFKAEMETKVNGIATEMETMFADRCRSAIAAC